MEITAKKIALYATLFLVISLGLDWIVAGENFFLYKFWAPKQEAARRQVYENTKSYHQGSVQRLNTLCVQEEAADNDHRKMLDDVINQEFVEWDINDVPAYLRGCLLRSRAQ